ncbi:MAG: tetratricopeptide repeat protein [Hellea sp.]
MRIIFLTVSALALCASSGYTAHAQSDPKGALPSSIYKRAPVTMEAAPIPSVQPPIDESFSVYAARVGGPNVDAQRIKGLELMVNAQTAFEQGNYVQAKFLWQSAAHAGDPLASYKIGRLHHLGNGVTRSEETALEWYQKAASQNLPEALSVVAYFYVSGTVVPRSEEKAIELYKKAASLGYKQALFSLGDIARFDEDYVTAINYYEQGADLGDHGASFILGRMYETGDNVEQSYARAMHYYRQSADTGGALCMAMLGDMYREGLGVPKSDELAQFWYMKGSRIGALDAYKHLNEDNRRILKQEIVSRQVTDAGAGDPFAQYDLGTAYELGHGVSKSPTLAAHWYKKSMDQGSVLAKFALARLMYEGQGMTTNKPEARAMFISMAKNQEGDAGWLRQRAARADNSGDNDFAEALFSALADHEDADPETLMLAGLFFSSQYYHRKGQKHQSSDAQKTISYLKRGAETGHKDSQYFLAGAYNGQFGKSFTDYAKARTWYAKASAQGDAASSSALAALYDRGLGGSKDRASAIRYYRLSAKQGDVNGEGYAGVSSHMHEIEKKAEAAAAASAAAAERRAQAKKVKERQESSRSTYYSPPEKLKGWRGGLAALINQSNAYSSSSYNNSSSSSYSSSSSSPHDTSLYGNGINTSREFHTQQWLKSPSNYYQNRYNY